MAEKLATIQTISEIVPIEGADRIVLARVLGYQSVIKKDDFKVNDKVVFIIPDTVLPDKPWAAFYKSKSSRVRAIKLKGVWSYGIIESLKNLELPDLEVGTDVTELTEIIHYEPPVPQNLNAKCNLRYGLFKTDEEKWENLETVPYGEEVVITLKIDGQSGSYGCKILPDTTLDTFITSRSLELKSDCVNNYTLVEKKYDILNKLKIYCAKNQKSLCLRGECHGVGIQKFAINPHCKLPLDFAAFSVLNLDTLKYESFDFCCELCRELGIPVVPIIERAVLTPELIKKYSEDLEKINGQYFEGVVIKRKNGQSFKVISKHYDSKK